ncbi:acid sphingomyelinase-like phosphodiesterase 3a [Ditylenchus destructor]|nr:acid sphingomyelinase-like phosphodiesterase 3a [Ditylenchus destructor]
MLAGPSVTPWSGAFNTDARNPGFRVIDYEEITWNYHDIRTYYINLVELNKETIQGSTKWSLEYSMKEHYKMNPISPESFAALLEKFKSKNLQDKHFEQYMNHYNVMGGGHATRSKAITPLQK